MKLAPSNPQETGNGEEKKKRKENTWPGAVDGEPGGSRMQS
jgi:hypothetical protein